MNRIYAPFDAANIGHDLALERGDTVLFCAEDGLDHHRLARSQFAQNDYQHDAEFLFWAVEGGGWEPSKNRLWVGIVTAAHPLDAHVGEAATGYGYQPFNGDVQCDASSVATWDATPVGVIIRVSLNAAAGTCSWFAGNSLLGTIALPPGESWYYAATVSGGNAESIKCYANAGQQRLATVDDSSGGWWTARPQIAPLRLGTEPYLSAPTDTPPHERFEKGLSRTTAMRNARSCSFWVDGEAGSSSIGSLDLIDMKGTLIPILLDNDTQDVPVSVLSVEAGQPLSTAQVLANGVVESDEINGDAAATLILGDRMTQFTVAAQRRLILPNAASASVDKPWPILIGAARSVPLTLIDDAAHEFAVADQAIGNIGLVRNNGRAVDPADWHLSSDGQRIILSADLQGRVTIDPSANGQFSPGSYTDELAPGGHFEAMASTAQVATFWALGGGMNTGGINSPAYWPTWQSYGNSIGRVQFRGSSTSYDTQSWLATPTNVIKSGRSYRARLFIEHIPGVDERGAQSYLILTGRPGMGGPVGEWKRWQNDEVFIPGDLANAGVFEAVFHNAEAVDLPFAIQQIGRVNDDTRVRWVELYELPAAGDEIELDGVDLAEYCRRTIEDIGGRDASAWRRKDAEAIDLATGYRYGTHVTDSLTIRQILDRALMSCTGDLVARADGSAGIVRLLDPDEASDADIAFDITPSMLRAEPRIRRDRAPGLSTRARYRRNHDRYSDADFGDDFDPGTGVTMALRRILTAEYQGSVVSGVQLAGCYQHALTAPPLDTVFDRREDAQAELDRVCRIFAKVRRFVPLELDWQRHRFEAGQLVRFTYPLHGYKAGKKFYVRRVEESAPESVALTIWG